MTGENFQRWIWFSFLLLPSLPLVDLKVGKLMVSFGKLHLKVNNIFPGIVVFVGDVPLMNNRKGNVKLILDDIHTFADSTVVSLISSYHEYVLPSSAGQGGLWQSFP
jgi:hypothetical protein